MLVLQHVNALLDTDLMAQRALHALPERIKLVQETKHLATHVLRITFLQQLPRAAYAALRTRFRQLTSLPANAHRDINQSIAIALLALQVNSRHLVVTELVQIVMRVNIHHKLHPLASAVVQARVPLLDLPPALVTLDLKLSVMLV